jgi:hypothetical protein
MKLVFTEEELKQFIEKKIAEIRGGLILIEIEKGNTPITVENVTDRFFEMGRLAGQIEGQAQFLKDFEKFIHC